MCVWGVRNYVLCVYVCGGSSYSSVIKNYNAFNAHNTYNSELEAHYALVVWHAIQYWLWVERAKKLYEYIDRKHIFFYYHTVQFFSTLIQKRKKLYCKYGVLWHAYKQK